MKPLLPISLPPARVRYPGGRATSRLASGPAVAGQKVARALLFVVQAVRLGETRWLIHSVGWLWLAALALWGVMFWLGQAPDLRQRSDLQARLFQPLITGNLALASLLIWLDLSRGGTVGQTACLSLFSSEKGRPVAPAIGGNAYCSIPRGIESGDRRDTGPTLAVAPRWVLRVAGALAAVAATSGGLLALDLWQSDLAIFTCFLLPPTILVTAAFLHQAATLLQGNLPRAALLLGFLVASGALIQFSVHGGRGPAANDFQRVFVANSALIGLAVFTWLAVWGAPRREGNPPQALSNPCRSRGNEAQISGESEPPNVVSYNSQRGSHE